MYITLKSLKKKKSLPLMTTSSNRQAATLFTYNGQCTMVVLGMLMGN